MHVHTLKQGIRSRDQTQIQFTIDGEPSLCSLPLRIDAIEPIGLALPEQAMRYDATCKAYQNL
jgi:hypothetical protein